jgi:hypothetical protein
VKVGVRDPAKLEGVFETWEEVGEYRARTGLDFRRIFGLVVYVIFRLQSRLC